VALCERCVHRRFPIAAAVTDDGHHRVGGRTLVHHRSSPEVPVSADRLPAPVAPRLRRPTWRDPRLLVGIVIVALAVALGSWAVSSAGRTVPVFAADGVLTPGTPLDAEHLRTVDVRLGPAAEHYLRADEPVPDGLVARNVVEDGELVSRTALAPADDVDARSVAVPVGSVLSDRIHSGAVVDLWFVPDADDGTSVPTPLVSEVVVEQVDTGDSGLVVASGVTLHVLVSSADLPDVLAALGADGTIAVTPVAGAS